MESLIQVLESIKAQQVQEAVTALQNDLDIGVHVIIALPKIRALLNSLYQVKAQQQQQNQG